MTKLKLHCIGIVAAFSIVFIIYCTKDMKAETNPEGLFVKKSYKERPYPQNGPKCSELPFEHEYNYDYYNVDRKCRLIYSGTPNKDKMVPSLSIKIIQYKNIKYIKNEIYNLYRVKNDYGIKTSGKGSVLSKHVVNNLSNSENYYWISGNSLIGIYSSYIEVPQELLDDYLSKYPPTEEIQSNDLTSQNLFKQNINKCMDIIYKNEERRGRLNRAIDKNTEFKAMKIQCEREAAVRCWTGLQTESSSGCPIAFDLDDERRRNEWEKLKKETQGKDIIEDNINWTNPGDALSKCLNLSGYQGDIYEKLGMKESDLKDQ